MIKMINWLFITTIFFTLVTEAYSETHKLVASKDMPVEINLILESFQMENAEGKFITLSPSILENLKRIDTHARLLTKEDVFLIGKVEFYKTFLKNSSRNAKASLDSVAINNMNQAIKLARDPFVKWFIRSISKDTESLITNPRYKDYLMQKNLGNLNQIELKRIDKKVQLLYRWVSKINADAADFEEIFKAELTPVMVEALKNIEQSFYLMALNSSVNMPAQNVTNQSLKFFIEKKHTKKQTSPIKEKSIDDILEPVVGPSGNSFNEKLPEPSSESWAEEEATPNSLKNLPKPSDDADWLQDF